MTPLQEAIDKFAKETRREILDDIASELRARFEVKHALDVDCPNPWKITTDDGAISYTDHPSIQTAEKVEPTRHLMVGSRRKIPANHLKTAWVKTAIRRLLKGSVTRECSCVQILGECRRGRRNISAERLGPILSQLKRADFVRSGPERGTYCFGSGAIAAPSHTEFEIEDATN